MILSQISQEYEMRLNYINNKSTVNIKNLLSKDPNKKQPFVFSFLRWVNFLFPDKN
jgi:hypothetical protein